MSKLALLVGIDRYGSDAFETLSCCEADAKSMESLLARHQASEGENKGPPNYSTRLLTGAGLLEPIDDDERLESVVSIVHRRKRRRRSAGAQHTW